MTAVEHVHHFTPLPDGQGPTCPARVSRGRLCGQRLALARSIRAYYPVRSWSRDQLLLAASDFSEPLEEDDAFLWCAAGHEWAVPDKLEFE